MPPLGLQKETRQLVKWAEKQGADATWTNGGHLRISYQGRTCILSMSGKAYGRGYKNMRRQVERVIGARYA